MVLWLMFKLCVVTVGRDTETKCFSSEAETSTYSESLVQQKRTEKLQIRKIKTKKKREKLFN